MLSVDISEGNAHGYIGSFPYHPVGAGSYSSFSLQTGEEDVGFFGAGDRFLIGEVASSFWVLDGTRLVVG